jgi:hypothetical protein
MMAGPLIKITQAPSPFSCTPKINVKHTESPLSTFTLSSILRRHGI